MACASLFSTGCGAEKTGEASNGGVVGVNAGDGGGEESGEEGAGATRVTGV